MGLSNEAAAAAVAQDGEGLLRITTSRSFPAFPFLRIRACPSVARALEVVQPIAKRVPQKPLVSRQNSKSPEPLHLSTEKDEAAPLEEVMVVVTLAMVAVMPFLVAEGKVLMLSHSIRLWD